MMRVLLTSLFCTLVLLGGVSYAQSVSSENVPAYEIDPQQTARFSLKVGEVVVERPLSMVNIAALRSLGVAGSTHTERRFLGVSTKGYYVVQDFYQESGKKRTDPFVMTPYDFLKDIRSSSALSSDWADGVFIEWYETGQKSLERQKEGGVWHGRQVEWLPNGHKWEEGYFQNGERCGVWIEWDRDGNKVREEVLPHC